MQWLDVLVRGQAGVWRHSVSPSERWHLVAQGCGWGAEISLWCRLEGEDLLAPVARWRAEGMLEALAHHRRCREGLASCPEGASVEAVLAKLPKGPRLGRPKRAPRPQAVAWAEGA